MRHPGACLLLVLLSGSACEIKEPGAPKNAPRSAPASAPGAPPPASATCPLCDLYDRLAPTVVGVFGQGLAVPTRADAFEDFVRRHFGEALAIGMGTGVIVDRAGLVLTNHHVVAGAVELGVRLSGGEVREATLVGFDPDTDLALLRIVGGGAFPAASLGTSGEVRVGQPVAALGNPAGLSLTLSSGVISATDRRAGQGSDPGLKPGVRYLQTDAALSRGSSGAPLFDLEGRVVGLATMVHATAAGVGFAVPADRIREVLPRLRDGWQGSAWLGLRLAPVGGPSGAGGHGLLVEEVVAGGPAAAAGVAVDDLLVGLAGQPVSDRDGLARLLAGTSAGRSLPLEVERGSERLTLQITPAARPTSDE